MIRPVVEIGDRVAVVATVTERVKDRVMLMLDSRLVWPDPTAKAAALQATVT